MYPPDADRLRIDECLSTVAQWQWHQEVGLTIALDEVWAPRHGLQTTGRTPLYATAPRLGSSVRSADPGCPQTCSGTKAGAVPQSGYATL